MGGLGEQWFFYWERGKGIILGLSLGMGVRKGNVRKGIPRLEGVEKGRVMDSRCCVFL